MSDEILVIDGHVQFTGRGFQFFETLQPALVCEDPIGHTTCKAKSAARMAELSDADKAARAAKAEEVKAEVEAVAVAKAEADKQALANKAGVMKHEARRLAGLKLIGRQDAAKEIAAGLIAKANAEQAKAVQDAQDGLQVAMSEAQAERDAAEKEIEATDWIAKATEHIEAAKDAASKDA